MNNPGYAASVWAAARYYRGNPPMRAKMSAILKDLYREFCLKVRLSALLGGPYVLRKIRQQEKQLAAGWTYEPPTFYEKNYGGDEQPAKEPRDADAVPCRYVVPSTA